MHLELLEFLADPKTGSPLSLESGHTAHDGAITAGELRGDDGGSYAIREGVPRMVPDSDSSVTADEGATQRSFGAKWAQYQEADKTRLSEFQYRWFDERFGFADEAGFASFLEGKRRILDAGTGPGLCAARCAALSDARVAGMDLSESVTAASASYGAQPNLDYVQGDILNPPFRPGTFDLVVADQVLHHTPDCVAAFARMAALVAPGGQIAAYVYRKKPIIRELVDDHVIDLTSRLSFEQCLELSEQLRNSARLSRIGATVKLERGVPLLGIERVSTTSSD